MEPHFVFAGPELILRFDNSRPIKAAAFAKVLKDLASDYKRLYRDDLVIVAMPEGSLIAKLRSFSKFAESANHILDFGKNLGGYMVGIAGLAIAGMHYAPPDTPLKAAQSMAALAVQSHSRMELRYSEPGKQELILNITPDQARDVEINARNHARRAARDALGDAPRLPPRDEPGVLSAPISADYSGLKVQLADIGRKPGGFANLDPDVRKLIVTLVLELHRTSPLRISQLIRELEHEGNVEAAALVREIVTPKGGGHIALLPGS